jgi:hypothetical protein
VLLWPLISYSDWRDAWILRLIGERHGPVLRRALPEFTDGSERTPFRLRQRPVRARASGPSRASRVLPIGGFALLLTLAATVILAVAVLGFTIARSRDGGHAVPALGGHASVGILAVSFPTGWRRETSPLASQLGLNPAVALAPADYGGDTLVIGKAVTPNPQLLPHTLLASLPSLPTPQTVKLGSAMFYRYVNLSPGGQHGSETVYAMSTTVGTVLAVCTADSAQTAFISSCERSLATLKLTSGSAVQPGPSPAYASAFNRAISRLNTSRATLGSQLRAARAAKAQASAARALAAAHAQAATSLAYLAAGPASGANSAVVRALELTGAAYLALGRAASRHDSSRYRAAQATLQRATRALDVAYSQLDAFGYSAG